MPIKNILLRSVEYLGCRHRVRCSSSAPTGAQPGGAGSQVGLHRANLQDNLLGADSSGKQTSVAIVTAEEATDFAVTLGLNFARLRTPSRASTALTVTPPTWRRTCARRSTTRSICFRLSTCGSCSRCGRAMRPQTRLRPISPGSTDFKANAQSVELSVAARQ
jgi:hypothetical protein